jgi:hypothetical protein
MQFMTAHYFDKEAGRCDAMRCEVGWGGAGRCGAGDMVLLISCAVSLENPVQVIDILKIFRDKIAFLQNFLQTTEAFTDLHLLLQSPNDEVFISTFSLISDIHRACFLHDISVLGHFDTIIHEMKIRTISQTLLLKIAALAGGEFPEIFLLCSFFAVIGGADAFTCFFDALISSEAFC